jgi:RNA polymerase sigma factor (sigma-70 family)
MNALPESRTPSWPETPSFKREMLATLPSLRAFAVSLSGRHDKADDLVQDTVMKAWAKQESFELGTNIKAWLFTILRNEFYSQMRKRGREVQDTRRRCSPSAWRCTRANMAAWTSPTSRRRSTAAGRPARSDHPDRRFGLFLRGGGRDLPTAPSAR